MTRDQMICMDQVNAMLLAYHYGDDTVADTLFPWLQLYIEACLYKRRLELTREDAEDICSDAMVDVLQILRTKDLTDLKRPTAYITRAIVTRQGKTLARMKKTSDREAMLVNLAEECLADFIPPDH